MAPILVPFPFSDLPRDVLCRILSLLTVLELKIFSFTSRWFLCFCLNDQQLWFSMCERNWGSKTQIKKWGNGKISNYRKLYYKLEEYDHNFIGFWRTAPGVYTLFSELVSFEWGPFCVTCSTIVPGEGGGYGVVKNAPFLWIKLTSDGEQLNYFDPEEKVTMTEDDLLQVEKICGELILVNLVFDENEYLKFVEDSTFLEFNRKVSMSTSEISRCLYKHRYEKISNCSPTPNRPMEGLWKCLCHGESLAFYHVSYSSNSIIYFKRVGHSVSTSTFYHTRCFYTWDSNLSEPPFSSEENDIYNHRVHFDPTISDHEDVTGMIEFRASPYGGRIWHYTNGTFGFSYLGDNHIIDLKPMTKNGHLLDVIETSSS